jgi:phosphatidylserine decarboxylase
VFPTVKQATEVWIKGKNFNLANLFKNPALAQEFEGGSLAIFRLAPQDYHRFHSPVDGTVESVTPIDGTYYTVNPMAVQDTIDVFTENKRVVVVIKSPTYGKVAFVCIGAMMVGSIQFTGGKVGTVLKKGDEIGYFAFGGSTVVTVFQKNKVTFDADLVRNSAGVIETIVKMGNKIGNANG